MHFVLKMPFNLTTYELDRWISILMFDSHHTLYVDLLYLLVDLMIWMEVMIIEGDIHVVGHPVISVMVSWWRILWWQIICGMPSNKRCIGNEPIRPLKSSTRASSEELLLSQKKELLSDKISAVELSTTWIAEWDKLKAQVRTLYMFLSFHPRGRPLNAC